MELKNLLDARDREAFRQWLSENHATQAECWVAVRRGAPRDDGIFWYLDAVEEALCFGWIDSTQKKLPDGRIAQRFTPRKRGSHWTELNRARCRRLERLGRMTDAGRAALPEGAFRIEPDVEAALRADPLVWANFLALPPLYRRVRVDGVQWRRNRPAEFALRLNKLIEATRRSAMYGAWNDFGRLTDDE